MQQQTGGQYGLVNQHTNLTKNESNGSILRSMAETQTTPKEVGGDIPLGSNWRASRNIPWVNPSEEYQQKIDKAGGKIYLKERLIPKQALPLVNGVKELFKEDWQFAGLFVADIVDRSRTNFGNGKEIEIVLINTHKNGITDDIQGENNLLLKDEFREQIEDVPVWGGLLLQLHPEHLNQFLRGTGYYLDMIRIDAGDASETKTKGLFGKKAPATAIYPSYQEGVLIFSADLLDAKTVAEKHQKIVEEKKKSMAFDEAKINKALPNIVENPKPLF